MQKFAAGAKAVTRANIMRGRGQRHRPGEMQQSRGELQASIKERPSARQQ